MSFVENSKRALASPLPLSCSALASCLWFPTSGRTGCVSTLLCMMQNDLIPFQQGGRNFVLLFVLVRDRDGILPNEIQAFSIPCNERDEKVIDYGNFVFLHDSPPAIWPPPFFMERNMGSGFKPMSM